MRPAWALWLGFCLGSQGHGSVCSSFAQPLELDQSLECGGLNMLQTRVETAKVAAKVQPWDVYWYLVGTSHKAGTVLLGS